MNNNSNKNETIYVDLDALTSWSNEINEINEISTQQLEALSKEIDNLNSYWEGNFATGFITETTELINSVKLCHNDMRGVANFLMKVVDNKRNI